MLKCSSRVIRGGQVSLVSTGWENSLQLYYLFEGICVGINQVLLRGYIRLSSIQYYF